MVSPSIILSSRIQTPFSIMCSGTYAQALFYYNAQADIAINPASGWCDYSAPSVAGRTHGDSIINPKGLKMLLAIQRDGQYLDSRGS